MSKTKPAMSIRLTILQQMAQARRSRARCWRRSTMTLCWRTADLTRWCFALLVAGLEDTLGIDPFTAAEDAFFPVTFAELVRVYENGAR